MISFPRILELLCLFLNFLLSIVAGVCLFSFFISASIHSIEKTWSLEICLCNRSRKPRIDFTEMERKITKNRNCYGSLLSISRPNNGQKVWFLFRPMVSHELKLGQHQKFKFQNFDNKQKVSNGSQTIPW